MKTVARIFLCLFLTVLMGFGALVFYVQYTVSDHYTLVEGERLQLSKGSIITQGIVEGQEDDGSYRVDLKLAGGLTVKTVQVDVVERKMVIPSGAPFGVKMFTRGVIVVGLSDINCGGQRQNPARQAGLETGDVILEIDGEAVNGNRMLGQKVAESEGKSLELLVQRDDRLLDMILQPVWSDNDAIWRAGIWVRDSSAGIGTMTYWNPETGDFGGLGHAICDVDTGELMPLNSGQIVAVEITGVKKGLSGAPGELQGSFIGDMVLGELLDNTKTGIYGQAAGGAASCFGIGEAMPVAASSEVVPGPASILTTIAGTQPQEYAICIEKVDHTSGESTKNMVIQITDPQLLAATGGILQGMSGSPIIQNGKLVGAVTHVFINDPTRGYGIFAENMLEASK